MKKKQNSLGVLIGSLVLIIVFLVIYILRIEVNTEKVVVEKESIVDIIQLNSREKAIINEMKSKTLKYGSIEDNRIYSIVAEEIATAFDLKVEPLEYNTVEAILEDVSSELLDFTSNIFPTSDNLDKFDFSVPIAEYKIYFFYNNKYFTSFDLDSILSENIDIKIGYTNGFLYEDLLKQTFDKIPNISLIPISYAKDIETMLENKEIDYFAGDTGFYNRLAKKSSLSVTNKTYTEELFMHVVTRRDSNPYFMTAINKLLEHDEFKSNIVRKINNYRSDLVKNSVKFRVENKENDVKSNYSILVREFEPYSYINEEGKITGAHIEIVKNILEEAGVNYVASYADVDRSLELLEEDYNRYDIIVPALKDIPLEKNFISTSQVSKDEQIVFALDNTIWQNYKSIHDLYSYRIGIVKNIFYEEYVKDKFYSSANIFEYSTLEQLVNAVERGEIDLGITSKSNFNQYAYENTLLDIVQYENIKIPPMIYSFYIKNDESTIQYLPEFNMFLEDFKTEEFTSSYIGKRFSIYDLYDEQTKIISALAVAITIISFLLIVTFSISILRVLHRSNYDSLTKIRNRKTLKGYIEKFKFNKDMAIAYIDVRDLKNINEIYGDAVGDKALIYLAENLQQMSRDNKVFRIDGDEFLIIYNYRVFDFRHEIKDIFNTIYNIDGEEVYIGGSMSIINLSKFGQYSFYDILNILNYTMRIAKSLGYIKSIDVDDYFVEEYFKMEKLRKVVAENIGQEQLDSVIIPIRHKEKLCGGILQPVFFVDDEKYNLNTISVGKYNVLPPKLLNDVSKLLFERLCEVINNVNLKSENSSEIIHIHEENERILTSSDILIWKNIMEKHKISNENIYFKVNPDIFKGLKGINIAKTFRENELKIVFKYRDVRAEILAVVSTMGKFMLEIDTEVLQSIPSLLENKSLEEIEEIFDENLFIESQINFINSSNCDVIISHNDTIFDEYLIKYYTKRIINRKIYYSLKYNEQNQDVYISAI